MSPSVALKTCWSWLNAAGMAAAISGAGLLSCRSRAEAPRPTEEAQRAATPAPPPPGSPRLRQGILKTLRPPAATPPADARTGPGGVRWLLLAPGTGTPPGPENAVTAEVTTWTQNGQLAYTTYADGGGLTFDLRALPEGLRNELGRLPPGAKARFWMPASSLVGWKPETWANEDLIIEYEVVDVKAGSTVQVSSGPGVVSGSSSSGYPPPQPGKPPAGAVETPEGIAQLELRPGKGAMARAGATLQLKLDAWTQSGLIVSRLIQSHELSMSLSSAPESLKPILTTLRPGEVRRIWLTPALAAGVLPSTDGNPAVLDIELLQIRG